MSARAKLTAILVAAIAVILALQAISYLEDRDRAIEAISIETEAAATGVAVGLGSTEDVSRALRGDPAARSAVQASLLRAQTISGSTVQTALVFFSGVDQNRALSEESRGIAHVVAYVGESTRILPGEGASTVTLPLPGPLRLSTSEKVDEFIVAVAAVDPSGTKNAYIVVVASLEAEAFAGRSLAILLMTGAVATLLFLAAVSRGFTRRLEKLAEAAKHLGEGDLGYRVEIEGHDEIAAVGEAFNKMAESIQSNRTALAAAVAELAQTSAELEAQAEENRRILDRTVGAVDEERRRLATELHDSTIQALQGAAMQAEYLEMLIARGRTDQAAEILTELTKRLRDASDELRRVIFDLRPPSLDRGGLLASLENRLQEASETSGLKTELKVDGDLKIPDEQEAVVYRFCQEAIANAVKHSQAKNLSVRIWQSADTLRAEVKDDGRGFDAEENGPPGHFGLVGMQDRAKLAGGRVEIQSTPGQGTRLELILPLASSKARQTDQDPEAI